MIIGIDPGLTGALAFMDDQGKVTVQDMPVVERDTGRGKMVNPYALGSMLSWIRQYPDATAYLESVHSMPGQGVASVFSFGNSTGVVQGVLGAFQVRLVMVRAQAWKKAAGLLRKDKDAARGLAIRLYPGLEASLSRKKDIGRADALLIAHFGREIHGGELGSDKP